MGAAFSSQAIFNSGVAASIPFFEGRLQVVRDRDPNARSGLLLLDGDHTVISDMLALHSNNVDAALACVQRKLEGGPLNRAEQPSLAIGGDLLFFPRSMFVQSVEGFDLQRWIGLSQSHVHCVLHQDADDLHHEVRRARLAPELLPDSEYRWTMERSRGQVSVVGLEQVEVSGVVPFVLGAFCENLSSFL